MSGRLVLAVDGGNSKTDLALVREDGELLALRAGRRQLARTTSASTAPSTCSASSSSRRAAEARVERRSTSRSSSSPASTSRSRWSGRPREAAGRGWARARRRSTTTRSRSCAPAPSRAGASPSSAARGSTASASRPDGRHARFPALGWMTGDWGGGHDLGTEAVLGRRARSEDGRGPRTTLERAVPAHFGLDDADRAGGGDPLRPDPRAPRRRARAASCSPRPTDDPVAASIRRPARSRGRDARPRRARAARPRGRGGRDRPRRRPLPVRRRRAPARGRRRRAPARARSPLSATPPCRPSSEPRSPALDELGARTPRRTAACASRPSRPRR